MILDREQYFKFFLQHNKYLLPKSSVATCYFTKIFTTTVLNDLIRITLDFRNVIICVDSILYITPSVPVPVKSHLKCLIFTAPYDMKIFNLLFMLFDMERVDVVFWFQKFTKVSVQNYSTKIIFTSSLWSRCTSRSSDKYSAGLWQVRFNGWSWADKQKSPSKF